MVSKLRKSPSYSYAKDDQGNAKHIRGKHITKIKAVYVIMTCLTANFLSSIALEAGGRSPLGNTVTKSAAFNILFRRSYNLKIKILVTNVITGLITTVMITLGDKYGIPYLYLPWLVNTMKGMTFCEGPALLSLARMLLPNITFPAGSFILTTFILYVEELCIWNDVFTSFQRCWVGYHFRKKSARSEENVFIAYKKKLPCQYDAEKDLSIAIEKLRDHERSVNLYEKSGSQISMDSTVRSVKSTVEGRNNFVRNRFLSVTG